MCSATDDPTQHDWLGIPIKPNAPRRYVLAGGEEPQASVALAVLGTMLTEAESDLRVVENSKTGATTVAMARSVVDALRRARNRVADAETRADDPHYPDPMLGTPRDGRHPDHACGQDPCPHIPVTA